MRLLITGVLVLNLFMFSSCSGKKKYVISKKKMVPILVDIHIADEIFTSRYFQDPDIMLDSAKTYGWIFKKHGITKADFDSSMSYYAENPDMLNDIYTKVIASVSKMEADLAKAEQEESQRTVIFQDKVVHRLPADDSTGKIPFDVLLTGPGEYKITARVLLQRTDQSVNPHITAYYWYDDGTEAGTRDYFKPVRLKKTDRPNIYSVSKKLTNTKFTNLRGYILDHDNADTNFVKHAVVMEITVLK
jgi:hypothetical protein